MSVRIRFVWLLFNQLEETIIIQEPPFESEDVPSTIFGWPPSIWRVESIKDVNLQDMVFLFRKWVGVSFIWNSDIVFAKL